MNNFTYYTTADGQKMYPGFQSKSAAVIFGKKLLANGRAHSIKITSVSTAGKESFVHAFVSAEEYKRQCAEIEREQRKNERDGFIESEEQIIRRLREAEQMREAAATQRFDISGFKTRAQAAEEQK